MNVLISVVTKRNLHAELVKALLQMQEPGVVIDIVNTPMPLEHARNTQVARFLDIKEADVLFIVDSDCVPPLDSVGLIRSFDFPVLSLPHPTVQWNEEKQILETGYVVLDKSPTGKGYVQHSPIEGLQKCDAVGGSGLAIKREVFEKLDKPYFKFVYNKNGELSLTEDFYFCDKVQKSGLEIYAYCDLRHRHYVEVAV